MLKKVSYIPNKIYRTHSAAKPVQIGSYFDFNKPSYNLKFANYSITLGSYQKSDPTLVHIDNKPIDNVELVNSAYARVDDQFCCLVDGEFIFDVAYNSTNKNGKLDGSYIFAAIGGDLRLVRIDSPLYKRVIDSDRRRNAPKIKKNDFQVGGVYTTPSGKMAIFLGHVDTYNHGSETAEKKQSLFYENFRNAPSSISLSNMTPYNLSIKKSTVFTEKIHSLTTISDSFIEDLKKLMIQKLKQEIVDYCGRQNPMRYNNSWFSFLMRRYAPYINMVKTGQALSAPLNMEKYLIYA